MTRSRDLYEDGGDVVAPAALVGILDEGHSGYGRAMLLSDGLNLERLQMAAQAIRAKDQSVPDLQFVGDNVRLNGGGRADGARDNVAERRDLRLSGPLAEL